MIHTPVPPEDWAAEGRRSAPALEEVASALVIGADAQVAALVARAMAEAQPGGRRVAIGDLVGALAALASSAPAPTAEDGTPIGLLQCFRDGLSVSAIAQPLTADGRIFALPSGGEAIDSRFIMESGRWPRLIAGFREVDALLLLVADARAPGLATLMRAVDGVVAVDLPPVQVRSWPLLATIDRPEPELPPVTPARGPVIRERRRPRVARLATGGIGIAVAALSYWFMRADRPARDAVAVVGDARDTAVVATQAGAAATEQAAALPREPADTITLGAVVNPDDSSAASAYTVELVAANTLAGANSGLAMRGVTLPAPTLAPVLIGADGRPWYRALTGAWQSRDEAEAFLATLRSRGLVRDDVGRVLRAPYALLLATGVPADQTPAAIAQWESRGIPAYALRQPDGRARLYAGAFETPGQSALVALSLRDIGIEPVLAFRTGRTF